VTGSRPRLLLYVLGSGVACQHGVPTPPSGPHRATAHNPAVIIQYPPPPVRVECVPPQPRDECVWVDGNWTRQARGWGWSPGAWVIPPAKCYHAQAYSKWIRAGNNKQDQLYYFEAAWYAETPGKQCEAPRVCQSALSMEDC
jgi:hypothetical protein